MAHPSHTTTRRPRPAPNERAGRALAKGQQTKSAIIDVALRMAAQVGLDDVESDKLIENITKYAE